MSLRRPGARWRLLVHEMDGARSVRSHHVAPNPDDKHPDRKYRTHHELPANTEFDEFVVGRWLHIEQMDHATWWMNIGGLVVHVTADRDGRPTQVRADMEQEIDGCDYAGLLASAAREGSEEA